MTCFAFARFENGNDFCVFSGRRKVLQLEDGVKDVGDEASHEGRKRF